MKKKTKKQNKKNRFVGFNTILDFLIVVMDKKERTIYEELTGTTRKRKAETNLLKQQNKAEKVLKLPTTHRPVRRKLCFDSYSATNKDQSSMQQADRRTGSTVKKIPFSIELENMLNISLEENRKRCIEKYNFDPVLEKPLEGKYKWEKLSDE